MGVPRQVKRDPALSCLRKAAEPLSRYGAWRQEAIADCKLAALEAKSVVIKRAAEAAVRALEAAGEKEECARVALRNVGLSVRSPQVTAGERRAYGRMRDARDAYCQCRGCYAMVWANERADHLIENHLDQLFDLIPKTRGKDEDENLSRGDSLRKTFAR